MTAETADDLNKRRALETYLVTAARAGDRAAMGQLAQLVGPRLMAHAVRLGGDTEAAQDIVQSAWVDILRALPALRAPEAFRAFALRIVTRKVTRVIRSRQRDRSLADNWQAEAEVTAPPLGEIAADALRVREAIDALPADHRATLALFYLEDLSVAEVATALDIPPGTVKTRLMHARSKLRTLLKGDCDEQD